jgi:hypothetical protein
MDLYYGIQDFRKGQARNKFVAKFLYPALFIMVCGSHQLFMNVAPVIGSVGALILVLSCIMSVYAVLNLVGVIQWIRAEYFTGLSKSDWYILLVPYVVLTFILLYHFQVSPIIPVKPRSWLNKLLD